MNIFYHISPYPSLSEDMVAKIYEASSPSAEVDSLVIAAPHTLPTSVTFSGRDKVTHIVRLFTATTGTLLHEYDVEPTEDVTTLFDDIRFKIGDGGTLTPAEGSSAYINTVLIGFVLGDFRLFRNGVFIYPNLYNFVPSTGEIGLIYPDIFGIDEEFLITRKPRAVTTIVNDSVVGKQFGGNTTLPDMFIDVTTTVNYDPTHLRHLIRLAGASANYVFPVGAAIPIGYIFRVTNFGAYASPSDKGIVTFNNAPLIWGSTPKTSLDIQFTGTYEFEFDGTNWNCTMYNVVQETPAAQIVYASTVTLGNMVSTDQSYTVAIPYMTGADYRVIGNLISNSGNPNNDNDVMFVIANKNTTSFDVWIRRISSGTQVFKFDFIIVK